MPLNSGMPHEQNPDQPLEDTDRKVETTSLGGRVYNVEALDTHAEQLEIEDVPLEDLRGAVSDGHYYWIDRKGEKLGPAQILQNWEAAQHNEDWADHVATIQRADLSQPIWVTADGTVINGMHRLTRAFLDNVQTVKVRRFGELPSEAEVK